MKLIFITLFPEVIYRYFKFGVLSSGLRRGLFQVLIYNPRDYSDLPHRHVDDKPYGGGAGMILRPDVMKKCLELVFRECGLNIADYDRSENRVILMSPSGKVFCQADAQSYSKLKTIILISGRYEGVDQRFVDKYVDDSVSVGSYVLTGGEIPSMAIADACLRLVPGVLGNPESLLEESHSKDIICEYPHYTRPEVFEGVRVPEVLLSGNPAKIKSWRKERSR